MDNNIYWTLFTETGAPEFYLLYRATTQSPPQTTNSPTAPHLGSPSGRAGAKRLRGLTAPIPPTDHL